MKIQILVFLPTSLYIPVLENAANRCLSLSATKNVPVGLTLTSARPHLPPSSDLRLNRRRLWSSPSCTWSWWLFQTPSVYTAWRLLAASRIKPEDR